MNKTEFQLKYPDRKYEVMYPCRYLVEIANNYDLYEWYRYRFMEPDALLRKFKAGLAPVLKHLTPLSKEEKTILLNLDYPEKYKLGEDGLPTKEWITALNKATAYQFKHFTGKFILEPGNNSLLVYGKYGSIQEFKSEATIE